MSADMTRLVTHFNNLMARGDWVPGIKLPSERDLAAQFRTSRAVVRKAINQFVSQGLLRRVGGSGTFVEAVPLTLVQSMRTGSGALHVSPAELMEARLLLEPLLPGLIVRHATARDFDQIEECLNASRHAASNAEFEHWDGAFHKAIAYATHNSFIVAIVELIADIRQDGEWGRLKEKALTPDRRTRYFEQHRAILAALRLRDEASAVQTMTDHLLEARKNLFGSPS